MQIQIPDNEKTKLRKLHREFRDSLVRDKIKAILLLSEGYNSLEISRILLIDNDTVTNWKKRFVNRKDIQSWFVSNYKSYRGKLSKSEEEKLEHYISDNIVTSVKQAIDYLYRNFSKKYSESGMVSMLHKLGFVYKHTSLIPSKYDSASQSEFKKRYEELEKELESEEALLFMDGVHPQHNTSCSRIWIKKGKEKEIKSNTGRQRLNINGIYNPQTQDILFCESDRINSDTTIEFFNQIEEYYSDKQKIYIIVDNARYYRNKKVQAYTDKSRIELIFLPPYSPNLNLIERLWKLLRKQVINNQYYDTFKKFRDAVLGFFDTSNEMKIEIKQFIGTKLHLMDAA